MKAIVCPRFGSADVLELRNVDLPEVNANEVLVRALAPKPASLSFEQAAAVPVSANAALQFLRDAGQLQPGQQVLINGASGGVGTFAVQIAKALGAKVTGVCGGGSANLVRSLGADVVVDYTVEDFTRSDRRYDLMIDPIGNRRLSECRRVLTPKATYVAVGGGGGRWLGPLSHMLRALVYSPFVSQHFTAIVAEPSSENLVFLTALIEAGKVVPVIDRSYPLHQAADAVRYQEAGHTHGKVVITV